MAPAFAFRTVDAFFAGIAGGEGTDDFGANARIQQSTSSGFALLLVLYRAFERNALSTFSGVRNLNLIAGRFAVIAIGASVCATNRQVNVGANTVVATLAIVGNLDPGTLRITSIAVGFPVLATYGLVDIIADT